MLRRTAIPASASGAIRSSSGESSSWRSTIGTSDVLVMRSLASSSTAVSTSHLYIVTSLVPVAVVTYSPVRPPMWKNGKTCSAAGALGGATVPPAIASPSAPMNRVFMMLVQWFRWVARAPFGMPVVPEVYMIVAWSSGLIGPSGSGAVRSSSPRSRSHGVTCGGGSPRSRLTIVASTARSARCGASRSSRSPSISRARAPESRIAYVNSGPVHHALSGTAIAPSEIVAQNEITHSG